MKISNINNKFAQRISNNKMQEVDEFDDMTFNPNTGKINQDPRAWRSVDYRTIEQLMNSYINNYIILSKILEQKARLN